MRADLSTNFFPYLCAREGEIGREKERQTDRDRGTERERGVSVREGGRERHRDRHTETETQMETDRQRQRQTNRHTGRQSTRACERPSASLSSFSLSLSCLLPPSLLPRFYTVFLIYTLTLIPSTPGPLTLAPSDSGSIHRSLSVGMQTHGDRPHPVTTLHCRKGKNKFQYAYYYTCGY